MASAKRCDACESFFTYEEDDKDANGIMICRYDERGRLLKTIKKLDLCPECLQKVREIVDYNK